MGVRLISNLAHAPFELDGRSYASVEGFWQGLKFESDDDRHRIAALHGHQARLTGQDALSGAEFVYDGRTVRVGRLDHWKLMFGACRAKFTQHAEARAALLATGARPLQHKTRRDSETIPGVIMSDIWTRIRDQLRK